MSRGDVFLGICTLFVFNPCLEGIRGSVENAGISLTTLISIVTMPPVLTLGALIHSILLSDAIAVVFTWVKEILRFCQNSSTFNAA